MIKRKNKPLFNSNKLEKQFVEAIKKGKDNPDTFLPSSLYLDKDKVLKKTKKG